MSGKEFNSGIDPVLGSTMEDRIGSATIEFYLTDYVGPRQNSVPVHGLTLTFVLV